MQIFQRKTDEVLIDLPSLRLAQLSDACLEGACLCCSDLQGAQLQRANLTRADLQAANLTDADLRQADLGDANLTDADLSNADLRGADLRGADLRGAAWPLGLGGIRAKVDRRLSLQLIYHAVNQQHTDPEVIAALEPLKELANKYREEFYLRLPEVK